MDIITFYETPGSGWISPEKQQPLARGREGCTDRARDPLTQVRADVSPVLWHFPANPHSFCSLLLSYVFIQPLTDPSAPNTGCLLQMQLHHSLSETTPAKRLFLVRVLAVRMCRLCRWNWKPLSVFGGCGGKSRLGCNSTTDAKGACDAKGLWMHPRHEFWEYFGISKLSISNLRGHKFLVFILPCFSSSPDILAPGRLSKTFCFQCSGVCTGDPST